MLRSLQKRNSTENFKIKNIKDYLSFVLRIS